MPRRVNLDESKHAVDILRGVKRVKCESDHCDFIIKVQDHEYRAHRNILSAGSPYFKAMLKPYTKENQDGIAEMQGVDFECVKNCIEYLYTGCFDIPDGKMVDILHAASIMQLDDMITAVCDILIEELNAQSFYETRKIANTFSLERVLTKCSLFREENMMAISMQDDFAREDMNSIMNILESKSYQLNEDEKFTVCLQWVGNNPSRIECLPELIKSLQLRKVSPIYLRNLLENNPIFSTDFNLYKLINAPLIDISMRSSLTQSHNKTFMVAFDHLDNCLRSYDPVTCTLPVIDDRSGSQFRGMFNVAALESFVYVLQFDKSVYRLNLKEKNSAWMKMNSMLCSHGSTPPVVKFNRSLFVIASSCGQTKDVEKFDPDTNQWMTLNEKPQAINDPALVALHESVYCIGGERDGTGLNVLSRFTPSSLEWVDLEPMKYARSNFGAVGVEDRIFVIGGWGADDEAAINSVECYNVLTRQWISLAPTIANHVFCNAHYVNKDIYIVDTDSLISGMEKYDIVKNEWSEIDWKGEMLYYDVHIVTSVSVQD